MGEGGEDMCLVASFPGDATPHLVEHAQTQWALSRLGDAFEPLGRNQFGTIDPNLAEGANARVDNRHGLLARCDGKLEKFIGIHPKKVCVNKAQTNNGQPHVGDLSPLPVADASTAFNDASQ